MVISQNHSIKLYFPYTFESSADPAAYQGFLDQKIALKVQELTEAADFLSSQSHQQQLQSSLWEIKTTQLDKRFHEFSSSLVNGEINTDFSQGFFGMPPLSLSKQALRTLNNGTPNHLGAGVAISLKQAATNRLKAIGITAPLDNDQWPMMFNEVSFYGLNFGVGMLVIDLAFKQPVKNGAAISHLQALLEINYAIARNSNDHQAISINWGTDPDHSDSSPSTTKGLSPLIDRLMPTEEIASLNLRACKDRNNTYSYVFLASEESLDREAKENCVFRIARKYNDLYLPENPQQQISYFEPFKTITHAFSLEGCCTYVDWSLYQDDVPESIKNFGKTAVKQAYAPLILLTYAEYIFLREMAGNSHQKQIDMNNPTGENLDRLRKYRSKLYDFRLNFRFTQISSNTNHNLFCNTNKQALEIEQLLTDTTNDVDEVEQYIADHVSQQQEARLRKFGILGSLFAAIIGWVDLWGLNLHDIIYQPSDIEPSSIAVFLLVLVALTVTVILSSRSPKPSKTNLPKTNKKV